MTWKRLWPILAVALIGLSGGEAGERRTVPDLFDLGMVDGESYITSVKNQRGGTCWAHGTMASIESNLLMNGNWAAVGDTGEPNLAEYHLDYWNGFNDFFNQDADPPQGAEGIPLHYGGDYRVAAAYFARGEGAVRDIDGQSYQSPPPRFDSTFHRYYPRDIEWYQMGPGLEGIEVIKSRLMSGGAIATCGAFHYDNNYQLLFWDVHSATFYQPDTNHLAPTHAVAIIGWNDYKTTQAPEPGAWKVKNSWGAGWGQLGYYYLSYYDKCVARWPWMGAVSFRNTVPFTWDHVYYHDYHGWRNTFSEASEIFNVFTGRGGDVLTAVSFFTAADSVNYMVRVYDRFEDGQLSVERTSQSGFIEYRGFHTIDLDTPVMLSTEGDMFYLYLDLSQGGQPYDQSSEVPLLLGSRGKPKVPSYAEPGQSYYRVGDEWVDFYEEDTSGNFCIKGLSVQLVDFEATSVIGLAPLDVTFNGLSPLTVEQWQWSFGDGGVATGRQVSHTYAQKGVFDVGLTITAGGEVRSVERKGYVMVVADSLSPNPAEGHPGQPVEVIITGENTVPVRTIDIPFSFAGALGVAYDSCSTAGCRTEAFTDISIIHCSSDGSSRTVRLVRSADPQVCLEPGEGVLLRLYLRVGPEVPVGTTVPISLAGYDGHVPGYNGPLLSYAPTGSAATITVIDCCQLRGDFNRDSTVNVSDLTGFISYLFRDGPEPYCRAEVDIDASNGTITVADLTYLISYLFRGGPAPAACP